MFDRRAREWMKRIPANRFKTGNGAEFAILSGYDTPGLRTLLRDFDRALAQSRLLKDSPTTTAGIVQCPGDSGNTVFLKRTNNKGLRFTCRYLFRSARPFRAARAASLLKKTGLATPEVLAAGERRKGPVLLAGYLVTATSPEMRGLDAVLRESADPVEILDSFLPRAAEMMAAMHCAGIEHGDLKLGNFYCTGPWPPESGFPGVWDLDGVRCYAGSPPLKRVERELSRLVASCLMTLDTHIGAPDAFFSPEKLARRLTDFYKNAPGKKPAPDPHAVAALARARWNRMIPRKRKEAGI